MTHFIRNTLDTQLWVPSSIKEAKKDTGGMANPSDGLMEAGEKIEVKDIEGAKAFAKMAGSRVELTEE